MNWHADPALRVEAAARQRESLHKAAERRALVIAVLGAESTGKTWLAQALSQRLGESTGLRCAWVPEWLRQWCDEQGRTPERHEQADIARTQHERIQAAAVTHDIVVADTTALMTAVYSQQVFQDDSLRQAALAWQSLADLNLVTDLDLPWVPDGRQRDGPQVREPVDTLLQHWLCEAALPFSRVSGRGASRLDCALKTCEARLQSWMRTNARGSADATLAQFTASEPGG